MSTPRRRTAKPGASTSFRLIELADDPRDLPVSVGAPVVLAPGVTMSLADGDGNAMIERMPAESPEVTIDGTPLFEIAHCRPLQEIRIGERLIVLLPPYGVYVRSAENRDDKQRRMSALLEPSSSDQIVVLHKTPKHQTLAEPRSRRARLVMAGLGAAILASTVIAHIPDHEVEEPGVAPREQVEARATVSVKELAAPTPVEAQDPPPVPVVTEGASTTVNSEPPKAEESPEVAKPDKQYTPTPAKKASTARRGGVRLPPEREAAIRAQIESYSLEAGFDPEGASRKLQNLRKSLPSQAGIRREIDEAIRTIKN